MTELMGKRQPNLTASGRPDWCSSKALKMVVRAFNKGHRQLFIANSAAFLAILPKEEGRWLLLWGFGPQKRNRLTFSSSELEAAFGLTDDQGKTGLRLLNRYGGDSAEDGKYLRWQKWVNIPSTPADYKTSPSVSIEIDPYMRECVRSLIGPKPLIAE